jgi:hypothetical protein
MVGTAIVGGCGVVTGGVVSPAVVVVVDVVVGGVDFGGVDVGGVELSVVLDELDELLDGVLDVLELELAGTITAVTPVEDVLDESAAYAPVTGSSARSATALTAMIECRGAFTMFSRWCVTYLSRTYHR